MSADVGAHERELLVRWADGDREAGDALLTGYVGVVHRFLHNKIDSGLTDLVQEIFAAATSAHLRYDGRVPFRVYLLGIARKHLLMHYRRQAQHARLFSRGGSLPSVAELCTTPSQLVVRREEERLLLGGLRTLPLDVQILLELYYWEELSTADIAAVLDVPRGTIKRRLVEGRDQLRAAISRLAGTEALRARTIEDFEDWAASVRNFVRRRG